MMPIPGWGMQADPFYARNVPLLEKWDFPRTGSRAEEHPLVSRFQRFFTMTDLAQNSGCAGDPDERAGVAIVFTDVLANGVDQIGDTLEGPAADPFAGDFREPAFDQVEP